MPSKVKNISTSNEHKKSFQFSRSLSTFLIYSVSGAYIVIMWMIEKRRILYPHNFFPRLVHINFSLPFHFLCHFLLIPSKLIFFLSFLSFQVSLSIFMCICYTRKSVTTPYPETTMMMLLSTYNPSLHIHTLRWEFSVLFINKR